jgi:hypothetical protein
MLKTVLISTALLVGVPGAARADRVALMPTSGVNVHEGYLAATHAVAQGHLEKAGFEVVTIGGPHATMEPDYNTAVTAGRQVSARYTVVIHMARLGSSAKVKLTAYDTASGRVSYRDQLDAANPDDIDPVLARLVRGMATGQPASDTADIETVTQKEADPLRKRKATNVFGIRIGVVLPTTRPEDGDEPGLPGMGLYWMYDVRTFLAEVATDFHAKGGEGDFTVSIGAYYPFSRENTTAYAGGGLRYGMASYGGDSGTGISAYGAVGALLGRLSTVQLRGEAAFFMNLFQNGDSGAEATSTGVLINAGIGF